MLLAAGALVLVFLAWGGPRLYLQRRDRKLLAYATHAIDIGDYRSAWVWLEPLYFAHPNDVIINRLIARFNAVQHRPEELAWRERVVQLGARHVRRLCGMGLCGAPAGPDRHCVRGAGQCARGVARKCGVS